jgi:hypothetical protein
MLVFKCFISGLLFWLSFANQQEFFRATSNPQLKPETVTPAIHKKQQGLISEVQFEFNLTDVLSKTLKTSFGSLNNKVFLNLIVAYNHKLLYFKIGSNIPLQLTTRKRIFPFHCFT